MLANAVGRHDDAPHQVCDPLRDGALAGSDDPGQDDGDGLRTRRQRLDGDVEMPVGTLLRRAPLFIVQLLLARGHRRHLRTHRSPVAQEVIDDAV